MLMKAKKAPVTDDAEPDGHHPIDLRTRLADEVTGDLGGSLNLRRSALRLVTLLEDKLADWVMVVVPDGRTGELALLGATDSGGVALRRATVEGLPLGRILQTGRTEQLVGGELSGLIPIEPFYGSALELLPAEVLGLGLTARGCTFGALVLLRRADAGFTPDDVAFAELIAVRAALALDSARLYEEQARVASVLQRSLRPPALPEIPGMGLAARYRPALENLDVGGDFYEFSGRDHDWLIAIGDVCGKGVEAAALTGRTRQSIRTAAYFDRQPATVLAALNSVLADSPTTSFVTALCARVRPDPDRMHADVDLATAGHPAPMIVRADGRVEQVEVYGTAAGVVSEIHYGTTSIRLERGDTMLMFTDGIEEARGTDGQYGMDRLRALLPAYAGTSPEMICAAVEQDVVEYLDGRTRDDMALLAVTCGT